MSESHEKRGTKRSAPCCAATDDNDDNDAPCCWICLEVDDGLNPDDPPLVRDCSCRGTSGFCHVSCVIEYAKQKSLMIWNSSTSPNENEFIKPWRICPNCNQKYQNEFALDLANAFLTFVGVKFRTNCWFWVEALFLKLEALSKINSQLRRNEAKEVAKKITFVVSRIKKHPGLHPFALDRALQFDAHVYHCLGSHAEREGSRESAKVAVGYYEKCRDVYEEMGDIRGASYVEANIAHAKSDHEGTSYICTEGELDERREEYARLVKEYGEDSQHALSNCICLGDDLNDAHHAIEAERLFTKCVALNRRIHGPHHENTGDAEQALRICQEREVIIKTENGDQIFLALRYLTESDEYVVQREGENYTPFTIDASELHPVLGTPVVCHGLKKDLCHLNGNIGDVRSWDEENECYQVHFDGKNLEPCPVQRRNIRVLIELPSEAKIAR